MTKTLILMRHAIPDMSAFLEDALIPLSSSGKLIQKRVVESLKKNGYTPDRIRYSPYRRTKESAEIAAEVFEIEAEPEPLLEVDNDPTLAFKKYKEYDGTTLLVGHMPSLLHIAQLAAGKKFSHLNLERSGTIIIELDGVTPPLYLSPTSC